MMILHYFLRELPTARHTLSAARISYPTCPLFTIAQQSLSSSCSNQRKQQQHDHHQHNLLLAAPKACAFSHAGVTLAAPPASTTSRSFFTYGSSAAVPRGELSPKQLTSFISNTATPQDLLKLVQQHVEAMNAIHLAATYSRLSHMCQQQQQQQQSAAGVRQQAAAVQELLQLVEPRVQEQLQLLGAWSIASIMHACHYLRRKQLMPLLLERFLQPDVLHTATAQGLANALWAACKSGVVPHDDDMVQLLAAFDWQLEVAKPQEIANVLVAVADARWQLPVRQCDRLLTALVRQLDDALLVDISNTLWACARMRLFPRTLLAGLERQPDRLQTLVSTANLQALANMAWACGQLAYRDEVLPGVLLQHATLLLSQQDDQRTKLKCQELCNICWAAAVLDMQQCSQEVLQLAQACSEVWDVMVPTELHQLYQVHLWLSDCSQPSTEHEGEQAATDAAGAGAAGGGGGGLSQVLTPQQLEHCRRSWELQLADKAVSHKASMMHKSVFAALLRLPPRLWQRPPAMEVRTADGAFSIDISAVTAAGLQLAVEVDGPWHFIRPGHGLDGPTQYRHRALQARGYIVLTVPYWDWVALTTLGQQDRYLLARVPMPIASTQEES